MASKPASGPTAARSDDGPNTLLNAFVGGVVTVVAAPLLPFAAIAGGGVAGYLQRESLADGATVGALAGAVAAVPTFLVVWLLVAFLLGVHPILGFASSLVVVVFVAVAGYLLAAGALGGTLGAYLRREL